MPVVVQSVPVLIPLPVGSLGVLPSFQYQVKVEYISFFHDGIFLMFDNLGDQGSELLCPPNSVEQRDLFLQWYFLLHPKFLHVALAELEDAIIGSLHVVRYRSLVISWALG